MVAAAGEALQASVGLFLGFGLRQDTAADGDHSIGGQHEAARGGGRPGLFQRKTLGMRAWKLALCRGFIQILRGDVTGDNPDLGEEGKPARARGGQDEWGLLVRQDAGAII